MVVPASRFRINRRFVSDNHTVSTLSPHWVSATKASGRFRQPQWDKKQKVKITTLNMAIREFGFPSFIKIDVEGYESNVLARLTRPVKHISIEFAAENNEDTFKCIQYLNSLSDTAFQFSKGESNDLLLPTSVSATKMKDVLSDMAQRAPLAWGDVHIKNTVPINSDSGSIPM